MRVVRRRVFLVLLLGLGACLDRCRDKDEVETSGSGFGGGATSSLVLAARQQGALLPPELADPALADDRTLPMRPFELPAADLSRAVVEQEPNQSRDQAAPLGPGFAARGVTGESDYEHYYFDVQGEPQLWAIEAVGRSIGNALYFSAANEQQEPAEVDTGRFVISNLFLAPGRHFIEIRPKSGSAATPYTVRAVAMGKPDLRMEREPNGDPSRAHPLRFGIPRAGLLLKDNDEDVYRFALRETGHVLLQVTPPSDLAIRVTVTGQTRRTTTNFSPSGPGVPMRYDAELPPDDYIVTVRPQSGGSRTPYKLRVDRLDPFALPADREPNNEHADAAPFPADFVLKGTVGEYGDYDWYRLPTLQRETNLRVQVLGLTGGVTPRNLYMITLTPTGSQTYIEWTSTDSILETKLPANAPVFARIDGSGSYQFRFNFTPGIPPVPGRAPVAVSLPAGPHLLEAFSTRAQTQSLPVTLHNQSNERLQVNLHAVASHYAWSVSAPRQLILNGGQRVTVPLQLLIPPDAPAGEAVQIAVRASTPGGHASATTDVYALCGAISANAQTYWPLPANMLGGLNVAATGLGARPIGDDSRLQRLFDGVTPNGLGWTGNRSHDGPPVTVSVELAGERPSTITGITLVPEREQAEDQPNEFDVLVSEDGQSYRQVYSGRLRVAPMEQAFPFAQPVRAKFAQLRLKSNHGRGTGNSYALAEWKVIAAPGEHPFATPGFNIADPKLGGHVVWSQPLFSTANKVLQGERDESSMRLDPANPNEWVIAFQQNRAAQISRLEWVQPTSENDKVLTTVDVAISTESPFGPWTPVGTWRLDGARGSTTPLDLNRPAWARFVRFSTTEPKNASEWWRLPTTIRIFERPADASYRSVAAEWGHYARAAIFERLVAPRAVADAEEVTGNARRDDAKKIDAGKAYRGRVLVEEDEDWYRIGVPGDHNQLDVTLHGDAMQRAIVTVQDEDGKPVAADATTDAEGVTRVKATVQGGKTYYLRLHEPPRSIALAWDNSGSVTPFSPTLYRALARFVEMVQPRRELVNLLPFQDRDPKFLLASWSDQPYVLQGAVQNYGRQDGSSNAQLSLLTAASALEGKQGSKAILFLTDAASDGYERSAEMWAALMQAQAKVFAVELHMGPEPVEQQQLMRDWADANNGHYSTFRTSEDIDVAFDRVSCFLRRPARYTLTAQTSFQEPPAPGALAVVLAAGAAAENAVELILDASGSMLQRMRGNQTRMDVARGVLVNLVERTIPPGTPFAFRAFGTREANCETDLLLKPQPLDRSRVGAMVRRLKATNQAKTPIAASLRAVAEDLKDVKGQKIVILITDGEETCGGDPAGSIQYLKQQGVDVRVNIVGFAVADTALKATFDRWAEMGGGRFFDARSGDEMTRALAEALRPKYQVTNAAGEVVGEGTAGGQPVQLPAGTYTVRVLTSPVRTYQRVQIPPGQTQRIEVTATE